jgi:uncharacterized protein YggU (UPF0235/DUF167 family)
MTNMKKAITKEKTVDERYIQVRATAGAKKESIEAVGTNKWRVSVRAKAERGSANARIKEVLAEHLGIEVKMLRLVKGATSSSKLFLLINHSNL